MSRINTFKIPTYEYYEEEGSYVSPEKVDKETISRIKARKIGIGALGNL